MNGCLWPSDKHCNMTWQEGSEGLRWRETTVGGAVLQHRASLNQPALWCLFSFSHTVYVCSFLFYSPLFPIPYLPLLLKMLCWLLVTTGCFSWGHSKSFQPLTAFSPDFIRNSGPYSPWFPCPLETASVCGMVAPRGIRLNPEWLENTILEVSMACICVDIYKMHKTPCELLNSIFKWSV